ncbi:MAG: transporter [Halobacteriales archaeon]
MSVVDGGMIAVHLVFGAIWIGAVAFVTLGVLPLARDGEFDRGPLRLVLGRLLWVSRIGALAMLLSGGYMLTARGDYTDADVLLSTGPGQAVLAMVVLWLVLIVIVEVSVRRIRSGLDANLVREPARDGLRWFTAATLVGVALFLDGALLAAGSVL